MHRPATTADLRAPTGLDRGARRVLLRELGGAGILEEQLVPAFLQQDHYADLAEYLLTVESVWGSDTARELLRKLRGDEEPTVYRGALENHVPVAVNAPVFLLEIPEPDFLTCVEIGHRRAPQPLPRVHSINRICERRGIPYRIELPSGAGFVWTGDALVNQQALQPALSALDDSRLAQGPRTEFETARHELRQGTPRSRKQAVAEACNAVESALKVLLSEHAVGLPKSQNLDELLRACKGAGLFPPAVDGRGVPIEQILAGPGRFGNRRGRHGGGAVPHDVAPEEAEAVVAAAAVAITFIAKRLP